MLYRMEDCFEVILEEHSSRWFSHQQSGPSVTLLIGSAFAGVYGLWAMFCMPGLRVPFRLKVPFLPSTKEQTLNVIKLLEGRKGHLADLGSGDGRLVTLYLCISSILHYAKHVYSFPYCSSLIFQTDLCKYRNVTVFLAPAVVCCGIDMWGRYRIISFIFCLLSTFKSHMHFKKCKYFHFYKMPTLISCPCLH
uniref:Uncharacterized protein n=1 Tax=Cyprinus carpio TaxID=7962 RepID=A0A8C2G7I3_CYPCA